jgi:hypothetical protein
VLEDDDCVAEQKDDHVLEDDACGECICFILKLILDADTVAELNDDDDVIILLTTGVAQSGDDGNSDILSDGELLFLLVVIHAAFDVPIVGYFDELNDDLQVGSVSSLVEKESLGECNFPITLRLILNNNQQWLLTHLQRWNIHLCHVPHHCLLKNLVCYCHSFHTLNGTHITLNIHVR